MPRADIYSIHPTSVRRPAGWLLVLHVIRLVSPRKIVSPRELLVVRPTAAPRCPRSLRICACPSFNGIDILSQLDRTTGDRC